MTTGADLVMPSEGQSTLSPVQRRLSRQLDSASGGLVVRPAASGIGCYGGSRGRESNRSRSQNYAVTHSDDLFSLVAPERRTERGGLPSGGKARLLALPLFLIFHLLKWLKFYTKVSIISASMDREEVLFR